MKLNGRKWLDETEQKNSEKNQKFLVLLIINGFLAC